MICATPIRRKWAFVALTLFVFALCTLVKNSLNKATRKSSQNARSSSCLYSDNVDLRLIIMTYDRPLSLQKLLKSLEILELDGRSAALEIWIDRNQHTGAASTRTIKVASDFKWNRGPSRVHIHTTHVGIYGQWIDTWCPHNDTDNEIAIFLEDDLSVSKYAYRWTYAVFRAYSHRTDFAGASLAGYQFKTLSEKPKRPLAGPKNHTAIMYKYFSTSGFAPKPFYWRHFQVCEVFAKAQYVYTLSHTRTVVRECCKGDEEIQNIIVKT